MIDNYHGYLIPVKIWFRPTFSSNFLKERGFSQDIGRILFVLHAQKIQEYRHKKYWVRVKKNPYLGNSKIRMTLKISGLKNLWDFFI